MGSTKRFTLLGFNMACIKNGKLIRHCKKCGVTSDVCKFRKQKDSRTGKIYTHNLCLPCYDDRRSLLRRKHYRKNRKKQIAEARKWNVENKDRYNKRRRIKNKFFGGCVDNFYMTEMV